MSDVIALLPDHIANQIAAGEVIQRPASAVKELLENAIDAGAKHIHLIIKDSGKELIQVNDDGKGMSPTDARRSFERHATSKIRSIDDLFAIRTMGFRGEALASIAAVAQVELRTRREEDEVGTFIYIDNSVVKTQEPCQSNVGTSLMIKNLFFNVPARRNFLKSNAVEMRHIIDEFIRVAMAYPEVAFRFTNNQTDVFHLDASKLKQRIIGLMGNQFSDKLVTVNEPMDALTIQGFITLPQMATKTRGNQFFFVNKRFIKSAYLNHAVSQAYKDLISKDEYPAFILFIDVDPKRLDINVHPTKQEIKFEDDRMIYSFISSSVRHALSKYSVAPSLDFNLDAGIEQLSAVTQPFQKNIQEQTKGDFLFQSFTEKGKAHFLDKKEDLRNWKDLYKIQQDFTSPPSLATPGELAIQPETASSMSAAPDENMDEDVVIEEEFIPSYLQIGLSYILVSSRQGFVLIDQRLAHQRVLYEQFEMATLKPVIIQRSLIPQTLELPAADAVLLEIMLDDLKVLGYEIEHFGQQTFIIQGTPSDIKTGYEKSSIEKLIEEVKHFNSELKLDRREKLIRSLVMQKSIAHGKKMNEHEMQQLVMDLFQCQQPQLSPFGAPVFIKMGLTEIQQLIAHA
jgi:DNA mismatch repair protein MutL